MKKRMVKGMIVQVQLQGKEDVFVVGVWAMFWVALAKVVT